MTFPSSPSSSSKDTNFGESAVNTDNRPKTLVDTKEIDIKLYPYKLDAYSRDCNHRHDTSNRIFFPEYLKPNPDPRVEEFWQILSSDIRNHPDKSYDWGSPEERNRTWHERVFAHVDDLTRKEDTYIPDKTGTGKFGVELPKGKYPMVNGGPMSVDDFTTFLTKGAGSSYDFWRAMVYGPTDTRHYTSITVSYCVPNEAGEQVVRSACYLGPINPATVEKSDKGALTMRTKGGKQEAEGQGWTLIGSNGEELASSAGAGNPRQ